MVAFFFAHVFRVAFARIHSTFVRLVGTILSNGDSDSIDRARSAAEEAATQLVANPTWSVETIVYWMQSVDLMVDAARAWYTWHSNADDGIDAMRAVLATQQGNWQPEVGHTWDAHEMLAEMLLRRNKASDRHEALKLYREATQTFPNRYHSLLGLFRTARDVRNRGRKRICCDSHSPPPLAG